MPEGRDNKGKFKPGNKFWLARASSGPPFKYKTPEKLWDSCLEYFEWVENNPLEGQKVFHAQGTITETRQYKMRAMTIVGLCNFLGITSSLWSVWKKDRSDLFDTIGIVEGIIYQQKVEGAAADLLNASFIGKEIGLIEKTDVTETLTVKGLDDFYAGSKPTK